MSRTEFQRLNADLFASILQPIKACLDDAEVAKEDVDEIVLVGGSTRIPMIRKIVGEYFQYAFDALFIHLITK